MTDIGKSTSAHIEAHEIESSQGWIELEHWGLWSSLLKTPELGYPRHSAGFALIKERYRTTRAREPLRAGEEFDDARGARADVLIGQCRQIYRDLFLLTFDLQLDDTQASKVLSRGYCLSKKNNRALPIDRKQYKSLKYQAVAAFDTLHIALIAA